MQRRKFIYQSLTACAGAMITPSTMAFSPGDIFSQDEIREFVIAAHNDLEKTQRIIQEKPLLLNCANQLAKGDFETALGGASHVGRRDIADFLVKQGARMDIFNLTFLGYTDLVKKLIESQPHYLKAPGPHGFSLLHHAQVGGHKEFAQWLEFMGLSERKFKGMF